MSLIVVTGDVSTTVSVVLARVWPYPAFVVEADPHGGVLASWFGLPTSPSLSDVVTDRRGLIGDKVHDGFCRVLIAPQRSIEAGPAIQTAEHELFERFARLENDDGERVDVILDSGGPAPARVLVPGADRADLMVMTHRQRSGPRAEEAVRLAQLLERVEVLATISAPIVILVIGRRPYGIGEIADVMDPVSVYSLPTDRRTARIIAGRAGFLGVRRSRLIGSARQVADEIAPHDVPATRSVSEPGYR